MNQAWNLVEKDLTDLRRQHTEQKERERGIWIENRISSSKSISLIEPVLYFQRPASVIEKTTAAKQK